MRPLMPTPNPARFLLIVGLCLLLAACSKVRLGYNNLDWLTVWAVEDYVPLNSAQEDQLKTALDGHLQWHCQGELPAYTDWLDSLAEMVAARDFNRERIAQRYDELLGFAHRIGEEITPTAAQIMASFDQDQVDALFENLEEQNRERREKYLEPSLEEQISQRAERLEERLDRWFGSLSDEQRELIAAWAELRGDQNQAWIEGRKQWQAALADALQDRQEADFEARVGRLLTEPNRFKSAEYRATMAMGRVQAIDLTQRLLAVSSEQQLAHLQAEIRRLRAELQSISCNQAETAATAMPYNNR